MSVVSDITSEMSVREIYDKATNVWRVYPSYPYVPSLCFRSFDKPHGDGH